MKGALVTFIAKVEGVAKEKFSGAEPQTQASFAPPPIKIPGGATEDGHDLLKTWYRTRTPWPSCE